MKLKKFILIYVFGILAFVSPSCAQTPPENFEWNDSLERQLCEIHMLLDTSGFVGNFGFETGSKKITFGHCNKEIAIPEYYVKILRKHFPGGVQRGTVYNKQYTYFIKQGFFRKGNYGVLFSASDSFNTEDDITVLKQFFKGSCSNGNWFYVKTTL